MTEDERHASALVAACAKEAGAHILAYAREAGLDPPSFLVSVAAVRASSALAAQPEDPLAAASRHIQNALAGARPAGAGRRNRIFSRGFHGPGDPAMIGRHHAD
jgi:hypothetical protein